MTAVKKALGKGLAVATLVAAVVALAHALKKNKKARMLKEAVEEAKTHVWERAKKLGGVSKKSYAKIVDAVMTEYAGMRLMTKRELAGLAKELKEGWSEAEENLKEND